MMKRTRKGKDLEWSETEKRGEGISVWYNNKNDKNKKKSGGN